MSLIPDEMDTIAFNRATWMDRSRRLHDEAVAESKIEEAEQAREEC